MTQGYVMNTKHLRQLNILYYHAKNMKDKGGKCIDQ